LNTALARHASKAFQIDEIAEAIEVGKLVRKGAQGKMDKLAIDLLHETEASVTNSSAGCGCNE
jgi:hypothetical protein